MEKPHINIGFLHELSDRFNLEEFKTLCADMGLGYDDLAGSNKQDKIRELVLLCQRTGSILNLVEALKATGKFNNLRLYPENVAPSGEPSLPSPTSAAEQSGSEVNATKKFMDVISGSSNEFRGLVKTQWTRLAENPRTKEIAKTLNNESGERRIAVILSLYFTNDELQTLLRSYVIQLRQSGKEAKILQAPLYADDLAVQLVHFASVLGKADELAKTILEHNPNLTEKPPEFIREPVPEPEAQENSAQYFLRALSAILPLRDHGVFYNFYNTEFDRLVDKKQLDPQTSILSSDTFMTSMLSKNSDWLKKYADIYHVEQGEGEDTYTFAFRVIKEVIKNPKEELLLLKFLLSQFQ